MAEAWRWWRRIGRESTAELYPYPSPYPVSSPWRRAWRERGRIRQSGVRPTCPRCTGRRCDAAAGTSRPRRSRTPVRVRVRVKVRDSGYIATSPIAHTSSASTRPSPSPSRSAKRWERLSSSGALKCVLEASSFITAAVGGGARGTAAASVAELPRRRPICGCERARRLGEVRPQRTHALSRGRPTWSSRPDLRFMNASKYNNKTINNSRQRMV